MFSISTFSEPEQTTKKPPPPPPNIKKNSNLNSINSTSTNNKSKVSNFSIQHLGLTPENSHLLQLKQKQIKISEQQIMGILLNLSVANSNIIGVQTLNIGVLTINSNPISIENIITNLSLYPQRLKKLLEGIGHLTEKRPLNPITYSVLNIAIKGLLAGLALWFSPDAIGSCKFQNKKKHDYNELLNVFNKNIKSKFNSYKKFTPIIAPLNQLKNSLSKQDTTSQGLGEILKDISNLNEILTNSNFRVDTIENITDKTTTSKYYKFNLLSVLGTLKTVVVLIDSIVVKANKNSTPVSINNSNHNNFETDSKEQDTQNNNNHKQNPKLTSNEQKYMEYMNINYNNNNNIKSNHETGKSSNDKSDMIDID